MYKNYSLEDLEKHKKEIEFWIKLKSKEAEINAKEKLFGHIHCPANAWDCPYFDANGCCMMYPDNDPIEECDDFATFWDAEDDYICYEKH